MLGSIMHALRFITVLLALVTLVFCGCVRRLPTPRTSELQRSFPLTKTQPDQREAFSFSPSSPFHLEFGRGSGWHGLDTVIMDETGRTVLHRAQYEIRYPLRYGKVIAQFWERTEIKLSDESIQRLAKAILELALPQMAHAYHADVQDGTQWVFWLQQAGHEKSIYFDNHFPTAIQTFADLLDAELLRAGLADAKWRRIPRAQERNHDAAIWKSIEDGD